MREIGKNTRKNICPYVADESLLLSGWVYGVFSENSRRKNSEPRKRKVSQYHSSRNRPEQTRQNRTLQNRSRRHERPSHGEPKNRLTSRAFIASSLSGYNTIVVGSPRAKERRRRGESRHDRRRRVAVAQVFPNERRRRSLRGRRKRNSRLFVG